MSNFEYFQTVATTSNNKAVHQNVTTKDLDYILFFLYVITVKPKHICNCNTGVCQMFESMKFRSVHCCAL